jgi:hypothetical protein
MSRLETIVLLSFMAFYFPAFGLYHLMIYRVNQRVAGAPQNSSFPFFGRMEKARPRI